MSTTTPYALAEGHAATISDLYEVYVRALGDSDKAGDMEDACYYQGYVDALVLALSALGAFREATCAYCGETLIFTADGVWVDETDGDGCSGDEIGNNENESHVPQPSSAPETENPAPTS